MGVVYRARHTTSDRVVALKTVKIAAPKWLDSIRREIDALSRIRHPGVVRILDHGVHAGRPWYTMDLLEGETLRHFGKRIWNPYRVPLQPVPSTWGNVSQTEDASQPVDVAPARDAEPSSGSDHSALGLPPAAAGELRSVLRIMRRVCATLAFLHGEGFVNRDLKPENILLVEGGRPVIIDFGLIAHHPGGSGREALEISGIDGTLQYMSPEHLRGEFLDARTDLYAVGCMLYELVAGRAPFAGSAISVRMQHLQAAPAPPSTCVSGVPPELDRLILKLLEKDLSERFGYGDEVAAALANLAEDTPRLPALPPARPHVYRSRFVGRHDVLARLTAIREQAMVGTGALVLLGGESGVGKTRVAMELTRLPPGTRMRVVTSELSLLIGVTSGTGAEPLQALRPLLRVVADLCQEGGPETTDRLLGDRASILARHEPLLADVPTTLPPPQLVVSSPAAGRRQLFGALAETLSELARDQPLLWVIDDLGWADELSLDFLAFLGAEYVASQPILILGTYRSEEASDRILALARQSHVTHVLLPRLEQDAVSSMVRDMLALPELSGPLHDFVASASEGNPFFVAEHVRTAVAEGILWRDRFTWKIGRDIQEQSLREALSTPRSIRDAVDRRLGRLTQPARRVALAAAVLGRSAETAVLHEVAEISEEATQASVDELLRRHVLEQQTPGEVRFAHDKLRETAYAQATPYERAAHHSRAAVALERLWDGSPDPSHWGRLGHHFALGELADPAAKYLKLAADHAKATYANEEAVRLYRDAILHHDRSAQPSAGTAVELHEALADTLALLGRRDEARTAYTEGLRHARDAARATSARLYRKVGKTWETEHRHEAALGSYEQALALLAGEAKGSSSAYRDEWIQVHLDQLWVYYFLDRVADMNAHVDRLEGVIHEHGSALQRARFLRTKWMRNLRRDRYVADGDTLALARAALDASYEARDADQIVVDQFGLGFVLLFHGHLDESRTALLSGQAMAEKAGDLARQARCLTYLTMASRMLGRVEDVASHAPRAAATSAKVGMDECVGAAHANAAWLALRRGEHAECSRSARQALETWAALAERSTMVYPFQWTALVPLIEIALTKGAIDEASTYASKLLAPTQQELPAKAQTALRKAEEVRSGGDPRLTQQSLRNALSCLAQTGYN
jgi:hypothetical protein